MRWFLIFIILLIFHTATNSQSNAVYVCNGPGSEKYHYSPKCRGLNNCSTQLEKVSISEARSRGHQLCGWEKQ